VGEVTDALGLQELMRGSFALQIATCKLVLFSFYFYFCNIFASYNHCTWTSESWTINKHDDFFIKKNKKNKISMMIYAGAAGAVTKKWSSI
jgi:hypothetical protein